MATAAEDRQSSPDLIFETLNAFQRTAALKAAIDLDVFSAIGEGSKTVAALACRCQTSERGMRILCDYLVILGFLTKDGQRYDLAPVSATFLDRGSSSCLASAANFLVSATITDAYKDFAAVVRKGGSVMGEEGTTAPEHPIWVEFARSMAPMMALPAELIARLLHADSGEKRKVLDVAAGHGTFGITLAKHNRNAQIFALDWPNVLEVAKENAEKAGVSNRYHTIPGNAFEVEYGSGYDLILLTNFIHHFDPTTIEKLLQKVRCALEPYGRAVVLEFVPNEDRVTPPFTASFSIIMLGTTPSGDAYTFEEYQRMFRNAGFSSSELHPLPPTPESVILARK